MLLFGIRNNIKVVRVCHYGTFVTKIIGISFGFADVLIAKELWLKICYMILFLVNMKFYITYYHLIIFPLIKLLEKIVDYFPCFKNIWSRVKKCLHNIYTFFRFDDLVKCIKNGLTI